MSEQQVNMYEGLFLLPQAAATDLKAASDHVLELLNRADAEVVSFRKWDERRLAFEIKGNKRGVYFLAYFRVNSEKLAGLERDCNLSEMLLRSLVTRAEHLPAESIEAAEGRDRLADEIRLRAESPKPEGGSTPSESGGSGGESGASAADDAPPTAPAAVATETTGE